MYYDFHTHLDMYNEIEPIIEEINTNKIFSISSSIDVPSYIRNKDISQQSSLILPTFGIHPSKAIEYINILPELDSFILKSPIIGEIGLDYLWVDPINASAQKKVFQYIAKKAIHQDKYMVIHTKNAESDVLNILTALNAKKVIVHWYSGPVDIYKKFMTLGWYSTFGPELQTSSHIKSLLGLTPQKRILAETDNPVGIEWLYEKTGMPIDILDVYSSVSSTLGISKHKIDSIINNNSKQIICNI